MGERERIGGHIAVGHLTSASVLDLDAPYAGPGGELHADIEAAVMLGRDLPSPREAGAVERAIERFGLALEIVDLAPRGRGGGPAV